MSVPGLPVEDGEKELLVPKNGGGPGWSGSSEVLAFKRIYPILCMELSILQAMQLKT
jgi:hypothetical protein